jgi:hypothetical protein
MNIDSFGTGLLSDDPSYLEQSDATFADDRSQVQIPSSL